MGVEYTRNRTLLVVKAKQEVILTAGTVDSPAILMRSGIGPKKHLQDLKVSRWAAMEACSFAKKGLICAVEDIISVAVIGNQ